MMNYCQVIYSASFSIIVVVYLSVLLLSDIANDSCYHKNFNFNYRNSYAS